jgi:hypothetical protein
VLSFELVVLLEGGLRQAPCFARNNRASQGRQDDKVIFWFSVSDLVGFLTRMDTDLETWTDTDWLADESD